MSEDSVAQEWLLADFEMPEDISDSNDEEAMNITEMLFKFEQNERIIAFAENQILYFDTQLHPVGSKKIDFPYQSASASCYPIVDFDGKKYGIFDKKLYQLSNDGAVVLRELPCEAEQFYAGYKESILFQDAETFSFKQLDLKKLIVSDFRALNALKLKQSCAMVARNGEMLVFPRFVSNIVVLERTGDVHQKKITKPGFQLRICCVCAEKLICEVDTKIYDLQLSDLTFEPSSLDDGEQYGWEYRGKYISQ